MCIKFVSIRIIYLSPILKFIEPRRQSERVRIHTRWWILFDISSEPILELPQISHKTFSRMQLHKYLCWASECEKLMEGERSDIATLSYLLICQDLRSAARIRTNNFICQSDFVNWVLRRPAFWQLEIRIYFDQIQTQLSLSEHNGMKRVNLFFNQPGQMLDDYVVLSELMGKLGGLEYHCF